MSREGASSKRKHGMQEDSQLCQVQEARATEQKRSHRCQFSSAAATGEERSVQLAGQAGPRFTAGIQGARGAEQATHKRGALPVTEPRDRRGRGRGVLNRGGRERVREQPTAGAAGSFAYYILKSCADAEKHGSRKGVATSRREPSERQQTREWLRLTLSKHKDEADVRWPVIGWDALARCRIGFKAASEPPCTCRAAIS
ncbi:hypothetical protein CIRG_04647 [Coccidioides immitis RMSCC 2394]|uniref:Uncharacterized protein n=1 Tax=Coccidioides immitis RMSCC 2394 TaxID=404692 RepID=A0A0J7B4Y4_COCIT|nr:hypothetical protein CIRG_04647 [Coccidioides immitis RMSCC 2394]